MKSKKIHTFNFLSRFTFLMITPVFFQYFALGFIWHSIYWGVITWVALIWGILILASPLFGRIGCGWFCFMGTTMDFAGRYSFHKTKWRKPRMWVKLLILVPFFVSAFSFYFLNKGQGLTHGFEVDLSFLPLTMDMHYKIVWMCDVGFGLTLALFLDRRWCCKNLCMMGALCSAGAHYSRLLAVVDVDKCTQCARCEKECLVGIPLLDYIKKNKGLIANPECILCGKCVEVCKPGAVSLKFVWNRRRYKEKTMEDGRG
jgi:ferredoxin-type protein NapH